MTRKQLIIGIVSIVIAAAVFVFINAYSQTDPVVDTVEKEYRGDHGLIQNYPGAAGEAEYLSEAEGLYLEYLLLTGRKELFRDEVERLEPLLQKVPSGKLVQWKEGSNTSTNALIDDIRIASALDRAGAQFNDHSYTELSKSIQDGLRANNFVEGSWRDYYDWQQDEASPEIHFSYFSSEKWKQFGWSQKELQIIQRAKDSGSVFYLESYNAVKRQPEAYNLQEVNMIDQVLIMQQMNTEAPETEALAQWIDKKYEKEGKIYGRYHRTSEKASVNYEAASVYALLLIQEIDDGNIQEAEKWAEPLRGLHKAADPSENTHFFDYMLAAIALERLEQAKNS